MGLIVDDNGHGFHGELRRESFVLFTDFGKERIELLWAQFEEVEHVVAEIRRLAEKHGCIPKKEPRRGEGSEGKDEADQAPREAPTPLG